MDSDEEVDYMSDTFLQSICGKDDIRPGLIKSHAQKYNHEKATKKIKTDERNRLKNPSVKEKEAANREEGLSNPIDENNVGFKMLQRLGFKPGSGLGKSGEGRIDPVSVKVKADRKGLGRDSALVEILRLKKKHQAEAKEKQVSVEEYQARKAEEHAERKALSELLKCQRVCWELDTKEDIEGPVDYYFWPAHKRPKQSSEEVDNDDENASNDEEEEDEDRRDITNNIEEDEFSVREQLELVTSYLRNTHLYCVWCGHTFEDEKDLQQDCPGPLKEDH